MLETVINYTQGIAQYYIEDLGSGVELEMVLIPEGTFTMGAPEDEEGSSDDERPQHQVTVPTFFIGRYQVTQAQWRAVANLPQVKKELKPEPSRFKGDDLPVEKVSWYDAVEFCDRLSKHTGRNYRLPSEAEWEYACRAGTTTPFHFGETITTDLANYRGTDNDEYKRSGSYGNGPKGICREKTTLVGSFDTANAFGLSDMHGNVREWCCVDRRNENNNRYRVLRCGSWYYIPVDCRSAYRFHYSPVVDLNDGIGLRVVCGMAA